MQNKNMIEQHLHLGQEGNGFPALLRPAARLSNHIGPRFI